MSYTCHSHVIHMSYTCHTHFIHMSHICHTHVIHVSYTCHTHVVHMSYTCHTHRIRPCSVRLGHVRSWMHVGHVVADKQSSMPGWARESYYYRISLAGDRGKQTGVVSGGRFGTPLGLACLGRCAGELAGTLRKRTGSGSRHTHAHMSYTCQNACQTHVIHMPYTWNTHGAHIVFGHALSRSVILGHGCFWQRVVEPLDKCKSAAQ